ncbi:MAG: glycosyltransferase family 2 protein [Verrucomicrobiales bacterium]|jgi:glycosyltransferase involved in cell wall biosynthesis|nr:glycosyltransferase family 2 protein [Verrucomicrobiales bacterium]
MNLSVCLITLNAEPTLARCLQSVRASADEIVIVDRGSADRTPFIATDFNARFIRHSADDADARALALQKATRDWVLLLDADDELSPALQQELVALKTQPLTVSGGLVNVVRNFDGQAVRFGKKFPDPQLRLAQKTAARISTSGQLTVSGATLTLAGELIRHADRALLLNPPPYHFGAALANHLFSGGLTHGALGWQISRLDARRQP